jgi:hypothetical protein
VLLAGELLLVAGAALVPLADKPDYYWHFAFPGFVLGALGSAAVWTTARCVLFLIFSFTPFPPFLLSFSIAQGLKADAPLPHSAAVLRTAPPALAENAATLFTAALHLGAALGVALVTALQARVDRADAGPWRFRGRQAAFWALLAVAGAVFFVTAFALREGDGVEPEAGAAEGVRREGEEQEQEKGTGPGTGTGTGTGTGLGLGLGAEAVGDSEVSIAALDKEKERERAGAPTVEQIVAALISE